VNGGNGREEVGMPGKGREGRKEEAGKEGREGEGRKVRFLRPCFMLLPGPLTFDLGHLQHIACDVMKHLTKF